MRMVNNFELNRKIEAEDILPLVSMRNIVAALLETSMTAVQIEEITGVPQSTVYSISRKNKTQRVLGPLPIDLDIDGLIRVAKVLRSAEDDALNQQTAPEQDTDEEKNHHAIYSQY